MINEDIDDKVRQPRMHDDDLKGNLEITSNKEEEIDTDNFILTEEDELAVSVVRNIAWRLLKHPTITPKDVVALGKALYALERMPLRTPGVCCSFGVFFRDGDDDRYLTEYIDFTISDVFCEIQRGEISYLRGAGSDTSSHSVWKIEVGIDMRDDSFDINEIVDDVSEFLASDCKIETSDMSGKEFHIDEEEAKTVQLTSGIVKPK